MLMGTKLVLSLAGRALAAHCLQLISLECGVTGVSVCWSLCASEVARASRMHSMLTIAIVESNHFEAGHHTTLACALAK